MVKSYKKKSTEKKINKSSTKEQSTQELINTDKANTTNTPNTFNDSCVTSYEVFPPKDNNYYEREFNVTSISGNTYRVVINRLVDCSCPDCQKRVRRCKHIEFVMKEILHEPYPRIYYDDKALDNLFKNIPGHIPQE